MMIMAMNHHGRGFGPPFGLWLMLGGIFLAVAVIALILYFRRRQPDGLSRSERCKLNPVQSEILATLRQNGGPVAQTEIGETVPADSDEIADALRELEEDCLISREWNSEKKAYAVYVR